MNICIAGFGRDMLVQNLCRYVIPSMLALVLMGTQGFAQILIDYDDGDGGNGIHDAEIRNGGWEEAGLPGAATFDEETLGDWINLSTTGSGQAEELVRTDATLVSPTGGNNAVISGDGTRIAAVDTEHTISLGEVFDFSYMWRDAFQWEDGSDQVSFSIYTTLDDSIGGTIQNQYTSLSGLSTVNSSYQQASGSIVITDALDVGKTLFVSWTGFDGNGDGSGNEDFARIDDIYLEASAKPSNLLFWTGDTDTDWNTASNWFDAVPNATDADARLTGNEIDAPTTVNISSSVTVNNLQFDGDNQYTVSSSIGETLTLGGTSPTVTVASGTHEISAPIAGTSGLVKEGSGTLIVSGTSNTYTGGTTVNGGTLAIADLSTAQGDVTANTEGTLAFLAGANGTFSNNISGDGTIALNDAALTAEEVTLTGSNGSFTGTINVGNLEAANVSVLRAGVNDAFGSSTATVSVEGSFSTAELDGVSVSNQWFLSSRSGDTNPGAENDPHIATVANSGASTITGDIDSNGGSNHVIEAATGTTLTIDSTLLDSEDEASTYKFQGEGDIFIGVPGVPDSGKIVGTGMNVLKTGTGTLTIATEPSVASADTTNETGISWGGTTTIEEGRMIILAGTGDSGEPFSDITVNAGAFYDVSDFGTYNLGFGKSIGGGGTIDANDGGTFKTVGYFDDGFLVPGDSIGTLTVDGNLSLSTFSDTPDGAMIFELGSSNTTPGTDYDTVSVSNNLTIYQDSSSNSFNLNVILTDGPLATSGSYTLFEAASLSAGGVTGSDFNVSFTNEQGTALNTRQSATVTVSDSTDTITLSASGSAPLALTWAGGVATWDTGFSTNWNGNSEQFFDLDAVTFDDTASLFNVSVSNAVSPSSITFDNDSNDYVLTGLGIEGSTSLVMNGTGTVTLSNEGNIFSGGIEVNSGTVVLESAQNSLTDGFTVNSGGTLQVGISANGNDNNILADDGAHGPITLNTGGTITVYDREFLSLISGGGDIVFEEEASGLIDNPSFTGTATVKAGADLEILSATALGDATGGTIVEDGGRLIVDADVGTDIMSAEPLSLEGFGRSGSEGALQVGGAVEHTFTGPITLTGDARLRVGNASGIMNLSGSVTGTNTTLTTNPSGVINISGPVSLGTGGITKDQAGTTNLSGAMTYSGDTTVNAGTLALSGSASLSTSANISVAEGATLDVSAIGATALTAQNLTVEGNVIGDIDAESGTTVTGFGTVTGSLSSESGATISPGGIVEVDVTVSEDARLQEGVPNQTYNSSRIAVGQTDNDGLGRGLVKFDMTTASLPVGGTVLGADLVLTVGFDWEPATATAVTIEAHEVTSDWEELGNSGTTDDTGGVTWNTAIDPDNTVTGETGEVAWTTPGGDFSGTVLGVSDTVNPNTAATGDVVTVSGANLDSLVLANLSNSELDFLLKLDSASEASADFSAVWLDSNSLGGSPAVLRLEVFDPTSTLFVDGDFDQLTGGSLEIEIGSTTDMDMLDVTGALTAGGDLDVSLLGGFSPSDGDVFDILDFASVSGAFDNINLPALAGGLSWDTSNLLVDGTLSVTTGSTVIEGDYSGDGVVSQADLDIVLLNWGTSNFPGETNAIPGGGPFDGSVSQNELDGVLLNWGNTALAVTAAVPEPTSLMMLGLAMSAMLITRKRA